MICNLNYQSRNVNYVDSELTGYRRTERDFTIPDFLWPVWLVVR
jgi:hypothetical protein